LSEEWKLDDELKQTEQQMKCFDEYVVGRRDLERTNKFS